MAIEFVNFKVMAAGKVDHGRSGSGASFAFDTGVRRLLTAETGENVSTGHRVILLLIACSYT